VLGVFDAARKGDLALAREQRDRHHSAQIHADGIVGVTRFVRVVGGAGGYLRGGGCRLCRGRKIFLLIFFQLWTKRSHRGRHFEVS